MSVPADISDEEMLARLAACDLAAAERVHERLMATDETSEMAELGRTYQRFSRSLRQTLALKARLKREQAQAARDDAARDAAGNDVAPSPTGGLAVARRVRDVRAAVLRVIWDEAERAEVPDFEEALEDQLSVESLGDGFCRETLDDDVARICLRLGLSLEGVERWRDLPDPPDDPPQGGDGSPDAAPDGEPGWRGSG
jgi:hypothetical protein